MFIIRCDIFWVCQRFDSDEVVNRCQIVGQIEGGDEPAGDIKRPYVQRMASWSFPPIRIRAKAKAAGSFLWIPFE